MFSTCNNKLLYLIFPITLFVICLNLIPLIFPSFFIAIFGSSLSEIDPFEMGLYVWPFLYANVAIFTLAVLFLKQKLPSSLQNGLNYINNFEVSRNKTIVVLSIIFLVYVGSTFNELSVDEISQTTSDGQAFIDSLKNSSFDTLTDYTQENRFVDNFTGRYFQNLLFFISLNFFGNVKIIAFASSILLLLLTYFFSKEITDRRFSGILSVIVVVQSFTFLTYDTIAVYSHLWVLMYIFSLFLMLKKWQYSGAVYFLSLFTKANVLAYFPTSLYLLFRTKMSLRKKTITVISYCVVIALAIIIWQFVSGTSEYAISEVNFDLSKVWSALSVWHNQFRYDFLIVFTILPLCVGLFLKAKRNIFAAESILFLILVGISVEIILYIISSFYNLFSYRFMPFIIFFALGIGILFSKKKLIVD